MAQPNRFENSAPSVRDLPHIVNRVVKTVNDDRLRDEGITFRTELVEMDDGVKYVATTSTLSIDKRLGRQFAATDVVDIEGTAWTTKNGGFYRKRHVEQARDMHRPSMIIGVQQNLDRYNPLNRTTDDMLAIYAFMAERYDYDPDYATSVGTSRGGMLSINLQKRAPKYGQKIIYNHSMVPCIPFISDTIKMAHPCNLKQMVQNEVGAAKNLELQTDELLGFRDTLDVVSLRGLIQQLKEGIALGTSNLGVVIRKSPNKDDVGDIKVSEGDRMSFAHKWPSLYRDYPYTRVEVTPGGGHSSCIGKDYHDSWQNLASSVATILHVDTGRRKTDSASLRKLIDTESRHLKSVD